MARAVSTPLHFAWVGSAPPHFARSGSVSARPVIFAQEQTKLAPPHFARSPSAAACHSKPPHFARAGSTRPVAGLIRLFGTRPTLAQLVVLGPAGVLDGHLRARPGDVARGVDQRALELGGRPARVDLGEDRRGARDDAGRHRRATETQVLRADDAGRALRGVGAAGRQGGDELGAGRHHLRLAKAVRVRPVLVQLAMTSSLVSLVPRSSTPPTEST